MGESNSRCDEAIRKEKVEAEARHGIRFGQTEIYCARCGKSWGYGRHSCQDIRLKKLNKAKKGNFRGQIDGQIDVVDGEIRFKVRSCLRTQENRLYRGLRQVFGGV